MDPSTLAAKALDDQHSETGLLDLPHDLLHLIFTSTAAPLTTCRAAASLCNNPHLVAAWLMSSKKAYPLTTAARHKQWDSCNIILDTHPDICQFDLNQTVILAAERGKLELMGRLLGRGGWAHWVWGKGRWGPAKSESYYKKNQRQTVYSAVQQDCLQKLEHPLVAAAGAGHFDVCEFLCQPEPGVSPQDTINVSLISSTSGSRGVSEISADDTDVASPTSAQAAPKGTQGTPDFPLAAMHGALLAAARHGHAPIMELIYSKQPAVKNPGLGPSVLCAAARGGHSGAVQFLLDLGASPDNVVGTAFSGPKKPSHSRRVDPESCPLLAAAAGGDPDALLLLVNKDANLLNCWHECLAAAARAGHLETVQWLLTLANTHLDGRPWQVQWYPSKWDRKVDSVYQLVNPHWQGWWTWHQHGTPLALAAANGHLQVVLLLLECGHEGGCGCKEDAYTRAAAKGQSSVMELLREHGARGDGKCEHEVHGAEPMPMFGDRKLWLTLRPTQSLIPAGPTATKQGPVVTAQVVPAPGPVATAQPIPAPGPVATAQPIPAPGPVATAQPIPAPGPVLNPLSAGSSVPQEPEQQAPTAAASSNQPPTAAAASNKPLRWLCSCFSAQA
jgi:hypothetical protein